MVISDNTVFGTLVLATERGETLEGGYRDVWEQLDLPAEFCHFRALQLARVGRRWEDLYLTQFSDLCPGLRDVASDWVGR